VPASIMPIMLFGLFFLLLLIPSDKFFSDLRMVLLKATLRTVTAPLSFVYFADIILADVFTSFARVFADLANPLCLIFMQPDFEFHPVIQRQCSMSLIGPIMLWFVTALLILQFL